MTRRLRLSEAHVPTNVTCGNQQLRFCLFQFLDAPRDLKTKKHKRTLVNYSGSLIAIKQDKVGRKNN